MNQNQNQKELEESLNATIENFQKASEDLRVALLPFVDALDLWTLNIQEQMKPVLESMLQAMRKPGIKVDKRKYRKRAKRNKTR